MKKLMARKVVVGVMTFFPLMIFAQGYYVSSPVPVGRETVMQNVYINKTVKAPPLNDLWEGVDKAIHNVMMLNGSANLQSVLVEINKMAERNEIRLPYSYEIRWRASTSGGGVYRHEKKRLNNENRQRKAEFERQVAQRIAQFNSSNVNQSGTSASGWANPSCSSSDVPQPSQFRTRDAFINAYAAYKLQTASDDIRIIYSKKIGGMSEYRMDMKREARHIWDDVKGRR